MKKVTGALESLTRILKGLVPAGIADPKLGALDRGILEVALMVAALDGEILPGEYAAFVDLAQSCRGFSEANLRAFLDRALRRAGYLTALAQVGVYTPEERVQAFVSEAMEAMPMGFAGGAPADIRRAFALWVAMGVSDGSFSTVERKAVEALKERYADQQYAKALCAQEIHDAFSPAFGPGAGLPTAAARPVLLEANFIARAEILAKDLADPACAGMAREALAQLIGK